MLIWVFLQKFQQGFVWKLDWKWSNFFQASFVISDVILSDFFIKINCFLARTGEKSRFRCTCFQNTFRRCWISRVIFIWKGSKGCCSSNWSWLLMAIESSCMHQWFVKSKILTEIIFWIIKSRCGILDVLRLVLLIWSRN